MSRSLDRNGWRETRAAEKRTALKKLDDYVQLGALKNGSHKNLLRGGNRRKGPRHPAVRALMRRRIERTPPGTVWFEKQ